MFSHLRLLGACTLLLGAVPIPLAACPECAARAEVSFEGTGQYEATAGESLRITLPVSGEKPIVFESPNLPADLTLDLKSGVISGNVETAGTYKFEVTFSNKHGKKTVSITLTVKNK